MTGIVLTVGTAPHITDADLYDQTVFEQAIRSHLETWEEPGSPSRVAAPPSESASSRSAGWYRRIDELLESARSQGQSGTGPNPGTKPMDWDRLVESSESVEHVLGAAKQFLPSVITDRIWYLRQFDAYLTEEQDPMSVDSLKHAVNFLRMNANMPNPDIVLSKTGNVQLEWHRSQEKHLGIQFLSTGSRKFVFIDDNVRIGGENPPLDILDRMLGRTQSW